MTEGTLGAEQRGSLRRVVLDGEALTRLSPLLEADRAQAVADLEADSLFLPRGVVGLLGVRRTKPPPISAAEAGVTGSAAPGVVARATPGEAAR